MSPRNGCAAIGSLHHSAIHLALVGLFFTLASCGETPVETNGDNGTTEDPPRMSITPTTLAFSAEQGGTTTPQTINVANR